MPKVSTKKSKKGAKAPGEMPPENEMPESGVSTAVAESETPAEAKAPAPEPQSPPAESNNTPKAANGTQGNGPQPGKKEKDTDKKGGDHMANSINIAKLQAMSMTDLNQMARE